MNTDDEINLLFQKALVANSNKKPFLNKKIVLFLMGIILTFGVGISSKTHFYTNSEYLNGKGIVFLTPSIDDVLISKDEKLIFKNMVREVAENEGRHVNSIHAELRTRFNYRSYHQLSQRAYIKIKNYLALRLK